MKLLLLLVSISAFAQFQTPLIVKPPPAGTSGAAIRLMNRGGFFTGFRADGTMSSNNEYQMPPADGTAGQVLATNGGKLLSWTSVAGNSVPVCSSSDLTDAYTCTLAGFASYSANYCLIFSVATANTNAATLDINGLGVKSILRFGASALVTNDILVSAPVLLCYDGTQFTLPPSASPGSGAFLDGGNTFGAAATLGTNDNHNLIFERNNVPLLELGPVGFNLAPSGLANFFTRVTKLDIGDITGAGGEWDFQVSASFISNSSMKLRDNGGGRVIQVDRAVSGSRVNNFGVFSSLIPRKRLTADGDDIDDTDFPNLGGPTAPWNKAYISKLYADTIEQSMYPTPTNTIQLGGVSNYFAGVFSTAMNVTASGFTLEDTTTVGHIWTATSTGGAGAWLPPGLDEYDVRNYGAVCNGSTDDTAAIQAAIDAATGISAMIVLPQGNCRVSTLNAAKNFLGMRGQGRTVSRLSTVTNAPVILIEPPALETTKYYLEFRDFSITAGDNGTSQIGIESRGDGFGVSVIKNMYFENLWRGIKIGHTVNVGDINIFESIFSMGGTAYTEAVLVNGTEYVIASVGTTDFTAIGAASNTPGLKFVKSGATGGMGTGISYLAATFNKVGIESTNTSSGSTWSDNFFGGFAMPFNATFGPRAFYIHGYVGDTVMDGNHMEGGWIGFDISCDNGTFATGICSYGENLVITNSKVDGYAYDYRLYNFHNSTILGSRGRGVLDSQISGTLTSGNIFDVVGRADTGSAIERAGWKLTTTYGDLALNAYDEGRIRIGDVTTNLSGTRNGISIKDTASNAIAIGQDSTHYAGLQWTYNATAGLAYATLYTINQTNPMYYAAAGHTFQGGVVNVLNDGAGDTDAVAAYNRSIGSRASCFAMHSTDSASSSVYPAGRLCGKYETASFTDELVSIQTWNGSSFDTAQTWKNANSTIRGNLGLGTNATALVPAYQLSFGQTLTNKLLAIYADPSNWFGLGMDSGVLRIETGLSGDAKFYSGGVLKASFGNGGAVLGTNLNFTLDNAYDIGNVNRPRDITASRTVTAERYYSIYGINPVTSGFGSLGDSTHIWEGNYLGTTTFSNNISFGSGVTLGGVSARALHFHTDSISVYANGFVKSGAAFNFQSGASVISNGNFGVSVSGATCTITRIDYGIVTGATCP